MLVFDLDDTLYPERGFVRSGFRAVEDRLITLGYPRQNYAQTFLSILDRDGSGKVFDCALQAHEIKPDRELVADLVNTYRHHAPTIDPRTGIVALLESARACGLRLSIITDGATTVQPGKLQALGLSHHFELVLCTDVLGPDRTAWKPSTRPFEELETRTGLSGSELVYIGDNPHKDFQGALDRGWKAVRLRVSDQLHHQSDTPPSVLEVRSVNEMQGVLCP